MELTKTHRILIGVVVFGAVVIAGIGFAGSYAAVRELALKKGFGNFSYVFPIGIDAGICVLLALDLLLTWIRIPFPLLRQTAWLLTAATIAFNGAAAWPDPLGVGMHGVIPILFVVSVEAARHAIGRIADITADKHMEGVRLTRWMLSPIPTFLLWRRMKLWELRSYDQVIKLEQERLVYQARLRSRFGRAWRRKAPVESLMPLRLARYGVPLADTAPSGLAAAGIEPALLPPAPAPEHRELEAPIPSPRRPEYAEEPEQEYARQQSPQQHQLPQGQGQQEAPRQAQLQAQPQAPGQIQGQPQTQGQVQGQPQTQGQIQAQAQGQPQVGQQQAPQQEFPQELPGTEGNPWFQAPQQEVVYEGGYDPTYDPDQEWARYQAAQQAQYEAEQRAFAERQARNRVEDDEQQASVEPSPEDTGSFPIPAGPNRTRQLGEGGSPNPVPDEESYYQVFKQSINGSLPTPREFGDSVEATFGTPLAAREAERMVNRFSNRFNAELEEDHIA
ncbi:DUF2637 domain-containing protein [Streptomyces cavernae]|uniref:DUF2637 domain-containing protein n=1 Tax=Streptomyces cavernae TaxID=2259034 RepID=UPI000FEBC357|nr:DUF2637 domain-containing protein [Streptomyces cavernae]